MRKQSDDADRETMRLDLDRMREREAATRDILGIISRSRDDEKPVFDTILRQAENLCGADGSGLQLLNGAGTHLRIVAIGSWDDHGSFPVGTEFDLDVPLGMCIAVNEGKVVHYEDLKETELYRQGHEGRRKLVDVEGVRTHLNVPLVQDGRAIGNITLSRREQKPFSPGEIALVETFAAQAVIAIENVRQLRALDARIARESASREILQIIGESRRDEAPVFDAILGNAARLCKAPIAWLLLLDENGKRLTLKAHHGQARRALEIGQTWTVDWDGPMTGLGRALRETRTVQDEDLSQSVSYLDGDGDMRQLVDEEGLRTRVSVPLVQDGRAIGVIILSRREVRKFSAEDIHLVDTFAEQAVLAIENVRQFREVQERLARERASAEVLEIISQSRDDEKPVFDAIIDNACVLCNAPLAALVLGTPEDDLQTLAAHKGMFPKAVELYETGQMRMDGDLSYGARCIVEGRLIAFDDMGESDLYKAGSPIVRSMVDASNIRSVLFVPLIRDGKGIGNVTLFRRDVSPFSPSEIALVETFANQAVIAIENVRQFREVQTRLKREEAAREILQAISASRTDPAPVFDLLLQNAAHLSGAPLANLCLLNEARSHWHLVAHFGDGLRHLAVGKTATPLESELGPAVAMRTARVVHIEDLTETELYRQGDPGRLAMVNVEGMRTILCVPLLGEAGAIGSITLFRREVKAFTEDEIALVETFAAQAVIAIENVRQFREVQERLEREIVTGQVLEVISRSRDDDLPVFDAILKNAVGLCGADRARLMLITDDGSGLRAAGQWGEPNPALADGAVIEMIPEMLPVRCILEKRTINVRDGRETEGYRKGIPQIVSNIDEMQARSVLAVPLVAKGEAIGCIVLTSREVAAYDDSDVTLVETFAAQAVIAIENVRQFREVQERLTRERALADILSVISQSQEDEKPVFDAILQSAKSLCHATDAALLLGRPDDAHVALVALLRHDAPHPRDNEAAILETNRVPMKMDPAVHTSAEAICTGTIVHIHDLTESAGYRKGEPSFLSMVDDFGIRTCLSVPLSDARGALGAINLHRRSPKPFSEDEIALVETFAAQAVIAIENVRQFRDVQERLAREAATSEVLGVISRSRSDAQPVFQTILENAARLCAAPHAMLLLRDAADEYLMLAANNSARSAFIDRIRDMPHRLDNTGSYAVRAVQEGRVIHVPDLREATGAAREVPQIKIALDVEGMRTVLQVPLLQGDRAIGVIALYTLELAPFTDDQIKLVETFAAQAVIAIENTKQLQNLEALNAELGDRVEEQVGEIERMGRLKRFLPPAVADTVVTQGSEDILSSHRALLGVLFCDIRGFTAFCETAEPEETIEVLQTYHEEMGKLINAHGAGVDHRMGDGIMVLFNDPVPCDDPAGDAVRLAIAMRARMAGLCKQWKRTGYRLGFGVGVSLGYATVGMVGFEGRFDYTASGTAINLASRLCDEAGDGEILLSARARIAVEDDFEVLSNGEVNLKGIREPVEVFKLKDAAGAQPGLSEKR